LSGLQFERHALQDVTVAVISVNVPDAQHG
jgi:hypothetical protein